MTTMNKLHVNKYETLKKLIASSVTNDSINPKATEGRDPIAHSPLPTSNFLPSTKHCPRVLAGMSYGGVWHASGGNSFTANLVRDAGGCYLWASDTSRELTFSFEEVYALADSVDVWVNPSMFATADEILALEPRRGDYSAGRTPVESYEMHKRHGSGGKFHRHYLQMVQKYL